MATLEGIASFPLTGGRRLEHNDHASVGPSGIHGDRQLLLFDPDTYERVSMRQHPTLVQLRSEIYPNGSILLHGLTDCPGEPLELPPRSFLQDAMVREFTDATPVLLGSVDAGNRLTAHIRAMQPNAAPVGIAKKSPLWMNGGVLPPSQRSNAPLHIVNAATTAALQENDKGIKFGDERWRANFVVSGVEAFSERTWVGRILRIGKLLVYITRTAECCSVPAHHQDTGKNLKDVSQLYPRLLPAEGGKPCFGVYGYPLLSLSESVAVHRGDTVDLLAA